MYKGSLKIDLSVFYMNYLTAGTLCVRLDINSAERCILVANLWPSCQTMVTNQRLDALHL